MLQLEQVLTYRLSVRGPLGSTDGSPRGAREYYEMSGGTLTGPDLRASIVMPGGDWFSVSPDGFGRPDVRVAFQSDDGALILMQYTGLVERNDAFLRAAAEDHETSFDDHYMRMVVTFDTGAERYAWLTRSLFLARGRLLGTSELEYEIYRVH